jgi:hypothetical protein
MSTQKEKLAKMAALFATSDKQESRPSNYYRFWKMNYGDAATVRILPDADENNEMEFTVEKFMHNLEINGEFRSVPCLKMYGEPCPICDVCSAFYKEEGKDSPNGKKYYRKKQNIVQALIIDDPLAPNPETGENSEGKVMYLNLGFQLFSVVKEALTSGDLDAVPWDMEEGYDFVIKKTEQGGNAKYDLGSKFVRKQSSLTPDEIALAEAESINLSTLIPAKPSLEKVEAMLNAALTGEPYDDGFGNAGGDSQSAPATTAAPTTSTVESAPATAAVESTATTTAADPVTPAVEEPEATAPAAEYADAGQDVLKMIRDRKAAEA